ncbi:MAG: sigma-70 family RNA polymerase sigma factor [Caldilineaceae bacterium]|nr:sigma-70 family RNA polymerase sigma factor [Caldilineaceae bacterium]
MSRANFPTNQDASTHDGAQPAPEDALIVRARAKDLAAFNQLVLTYQNLAYSVAYRLLQDPAATADAVQDSFIKAYRGLDGFQGGNFKSWLMRIVVNTCYDELRTQQRRRTDGIDDLVQEPEPLPTLGTRPESPEEYAERVELNAALEEAIAALPEEQRTAVVLCDIHGFAYDEIAAMTGWPMGTVKSRINRARVKIREILLQRPELLPPSFRPNTG